MAVRVEKKRALNAIEYVSVNDDAVDVENSDIEEYKKTGDISKLKFLADKQPTFFILNFDLKGKEAESVKNSLASGRDGEGSPVVTMGSWGYRITKVTLKDIKNPADLPKEDSLVFQKDGRGYAHDDLVGKLDQFGIVDEISALYSVLAMSGSRVNAKNS